MTKKKSHTLFHPGPIDPGFISASIESHSSKTEIGAHSLFLGQVRADRSGNTLVTAIEYSAYEAMAIQQMDQLREDIFAKYPITCLHVRHSTGVVAAGGICLFVFTSSPHRRAAIDACNEIVERIKHELPIWGRELFDDSGYRWKQQNQPDGKHHP